MQYFHSSTTGWENSLAPESKQMQLLGDIQLTLPHYRIVSIDMH